MLLFCDYIPSPVKGPDNGRWLEGLRWADILDY